MARLDHLQVAQGLFVHRIRGDDDDAGCLIVDQRDGAVLHFRGRIAFGVEVGDFLELQRTLQGHGEIILPAEEEKVFRRRVFLRQFLDRVVLGEDRFELPRNGLQGVEDLPAAIQRQHSHAAHQQREQCQRRDLRGERLRGGHADLRPGVQVNAAVRFPSDRAADDVADGQHFVPAPPGLAQAGEGVRRLAGLRDGQHGRVAVAKFAGVFDFNRQVRKLLEQIFAHEAGVPARAASGNHDLVDRAQLGGGEVQAAKLGGRFVVVDAPPQRVLNRARLLEDFLEHVVREFPALGGLAVEFELADLEPRRVRTEPGDLETLGGESHDVVVVQVDDLPGVGRDRVGVAGQKIFSVAHSHDQR